MDQTSTYTFLDFWNNWSPFMAYAILAVSGICMLYLVLSLALTKDHKARYDFINHYETKCLMTASTLFIIGTCLFIVSLAPATELLWLGVKLFIAAILGVIAGIFVTSYLKYYHPFSVEKRLQQLRTLPRISPKSNKPMVLLKTEDEKVYLDGDHLTDEDIYSVEYDVWVDTESGYMKIEKYSGHHHSLACSACHYQTLKIEKEEVVLSPTLKKSGSLIKFYKCSYCLNETQRVFTISKLRHNYRDNSHDAISMS